MFSKTCYHVVASMKNKLICLIFALLPVVAIADDSTGHSSHGSAFDSGMRTKPWVIPGVGDAPFPITSKNKEVQKWFNQGNALLHSFWFEEAERSFRWCLKLDPDCAMAYWGLAHCGFNWFSLGAPSYDDKDFDRYKTFLREAMKRSGKVSPHEQMYIAALQASVAKGGPETMTARMKEIAKKYPDDNEAKALQALYGIGKTPREENEKLIQEVLAKNPMHPGALHASIHNWDDGESVKAIKACELYGKAAPGVGHALHMPGHIYSKIGMWNEAAISMDSATRTELKYMNDRLALPFETWNYPHNRNYLCYIQEQLGMADASEKGARDMLAAPRDPELNNDEKNGRTVLEGVGALVRKSIKFEQWEKILSPDFVKWDDKIEFMVSMRAYAETLALAGKGKLSEARTRLKALKDLEAKASAQDPTLKPGEQSLEVNVAEGFILLAEGKPDDAQRLLVRAQVQEEANRKAGKVANDPPFQAWPVARLLGDHYRAKGFNSAAISFYEKALKVEPNDGFSLSGLAQAYAANGDRVNANHYAGRLAYVWSHADSGLRWMDEVQKLGLDMKPIAETPAVEHVYDPSALETFGPGNWVPFAAPKLDVLNINGKPVHLEDYRGKNIVLVFFLGEACVHCVGQLNSINNKMKEFEDRNTVVLGVCSASPKSLKNSVKLNPVKIKFLSDTNHENARRFSSYDDFEEIELHSTILIDKQGKVRWKRTGGDPFMNIDFLLKELKRINQGM